METPETAKMDESGQPVTEHLAELRKRILYSLYGLMVAFGACYYFSAELFDFVRQPIQPYLPTNGLVFTGVMDKFVAHIKLSAIAATLVTCPFWLYQAWKFVEPGLYVKEKKYATIFIFSGSVLFVGGALFAYYIVYPLAFDFLMKFGGTTDQPLITIDQYMDFFLLSSFVFGFTFELPLILIILALLGIIDSQFLREKRRYAYVILAIVSAVITPPDVLSMTLLLIPMMILYELSAIIIRKLAKPSN